MTSDLDRFLYPGSPFLPEVEPIVLGWIMSDFKKDPSYYPGEAIAKRLGQVAILQSAKVLCEIGEFKMVPRDVAQYVSGFDRPLLLTQIAYAGAVEGFAQTRLMLTRTQADQRDFVDRNLEYAVRLLRQDPSGKLLMNEVVGREMQTARNLYSRVGLEVGRRLFIAYSDIVATWPIRTNPFPLEK